MSDLMVAIVARLSFFAPTYNTEAYVIEADAIISILIPELRKAFVDGACWGADGFNWVVFEAPEKEAAIRYPRRQA